MYSWGGTLTAPNSAYNPASRWEGGISSPPAVLRRHCFFLAACHTASHGCVASGQIPLAVPFFYASISPHFALG